MTPQRSAEGLPFGACETVSWPRQWSRLRDRSGTVPNPFRTCPEPSLRTGVATEVVCALSEEPTSRTGPKFSASCYPPFLVMSLFVTLLRAHPCTLKLSICQGNYRSKLSICHTSHIGKLSMCQAIYHGYMSKQLAQVVPVLRRFLVKPAELASCLQFPPPPPNIAPCPP